MKTLSIKSTAIKLVGLLLLVMASSFSLAGPPKEALKDPKLMEKYLDERLDKTTGVEGRETELGGKVAAVIKEVSTKNLELDPVILGEYSKTMVRTMNHGGAYVHEYNDALVKMHLTAISFAKDHDMWQQLVDKDIQTTEYMMKRMAAGIKMTGRKDYALKGIFEQTTCFYHLVNNLKWNSPTSVTYTSPYKRVLEASQAIKIFPDLTEQEIHEKFTKPRYLGYAKIMGVNLNVSPLGDDGSITVSLAD